VNRKIAAWLTVPAVILSICGDAGAVAEYILTDNYSTGPGGYAYNSLYFEVVPNQEFSLDVYGGRTRVSEPVPDTTRSLGFGGWVRLTHKLDLSVDYNTYDGAKAQVMRLPDMEMVRETPNRLKVETLAATIGLDLLADESSEGEGQEFSSKLSLGMAKATHLMPIFIERFVPSRGEWVGRELTPYTVNDRSYSAGLSLGYGGTTVSASYRRHHYTLPPPPPESSRPEIARVLDRVNTATIDMLPAFPRYESGAKIRQQLPARIGATAAYEYILSDRTGQVSRYITGELSWEAFTWLELRGGSYWVRENRETTRYTTAGVSLYF
jgi:hypothetical protein